MNILSFDNDFSGNTLSDKDVLSAFKQHPEKTTTIQQGMSVKEISDVVSDKIIELLKIEKLSYNQLIKKLKPVRQRSLWLVITFLISEEIVMSVDKDMLTLKGRQD